MITFDMRVTRPRGPARRLCLGCEDCTGMCQAVFDMLSIPPAVLKPKVSSR